MPQKSLGRHIGQSKRCKEKYGKDFDDMKADRKKQNVSDYYKNNVENISLWKKTHYSENSQAFKEKRAEYNSQHRDAINAKQKEYNN